MVTGSIEHNKISIYNTQYPYDYTSLNVTSETTGRKAPVSGTFSIQNTEGGHKAYFCSIWKLSEVNGAEQKEAARRLAKEIFTTLQQKWHLSNIQNEYQYLRH